MVPLNFVASEETMRVLVDLPTDSLVGVLALDARRRRLLEAIVQQYSAATVLGALYDDAEAAAGLVEAADLVLVTNAAELPGAWRRRPSDWCGLAGRWNRAAWAAGG